MAPDGRNYKAVWGDVEIVTDAFLGIKTNRGSTNWFAKVGDDNNHVIVAGCQIHYAVRCDTKPITEDVRDYTIKDGVGIKYHMRPANIYIVESTNHD